MANPFTKGWKYLMASFDQKIDENADPRVQIKQAVDAAKKQYQEITEQASAIVGNRNQLEMRLNRLLKTQEDHQNQTRRALQLADEAAAAGDTTKANEYNSTAEILASQLVATEQEIEQTKTLYEQAKAAADQAQAQQQEAEVRLKEQLAEVDKLLAQADQAEMQEKSSEAMTQIDTSLAPDGNVPTLDSVRDKIERRYATALGQQELVGNTVNDRMAEISSTGTDMKAAARLAEIRASMGSSQIGEIEAGDTPAGHTPAGETPEANTEETSQEK